MSRTLRISVAILAALLASVYFALDTVTTWRANEDEVLNIAGILSMAPPAPLLIPFAFFFELALDLAKGALAGLVLYFIPSWLFSERTIAYWVVRETPIREEEWLAYLSSSESASSPVGVWYGTVPPDLPELFNSQPGIRFFPVSPTARRLARKAANSLDGYVQMR